MNEVERILTQFGKDLDKHYGINDFGCDECLKLVAQAKLALIKWIEGKKRKEIGKTNLWEISNGDLDLEFNLALQALIDEVKL